MAFSFELGISENAAVCTTMIEWVETGSRAGMGTRLESAILRGEMRASARISWTRLNLAQRWHYCRNEPPTSSCNAVTTRWRTARTSSSVSVRSPDR